MYALVQYKDNKKHSTRELPERTRAEAERLKELVVDGFGYETKLVKL